MFAQNKFLFIIYALLCTQIVGAQEVDPPEYSKFPLNISIGNHAVGFPFENLFAAFNPSISVGTERKLNKSKKHQLIASSNLGFIRNKVIGNTITFDINIGYRYTSRFGIYTETHLGLGAINQFHPNDIYTLTETGNKYEKVSNSGTFSNLTGLRMGIGYDLSRRSRVPLSVGLSHNFFIQTPYFDVANFPIMPQSTTNISITFKFKK